MPTLNTVTVDVPLVDEFGNFIVVDDQGTKLIVDSFSFTTESNSLGSLTTQEAHEFADGRKLAVTPPMPPRTWEVRIVEDGDTTYYLTVFNLRFLGGKHTSLYRALGQISGTYIRFGAKGIPDSIVGGVTGTQTNGPFAAFDLFPISPVLPGEETFSINAGGGTVTDYAWTFAKDGVTEFNPSGASLSSTTQNLTVGSWTISCDVSIDGEVVSVAGQSLTVDNLDYAGDMTNSVPTPVIGQSFTLGMPVNSTRLLGSINWSFNVELPSGVRVDLTEGVDYTSTASGNTIDVVFLTAGIFEATATAIDTDGNALATRANLDIVDMDSSTTVTNHSIMSQATADALVQGDTHMIMLGDSIGSHVHSERWRRGMVDSFQPARWVGIQPAIEDTNDTAHDGSRWSTSFFTQNLGNTLSSANTRRDGTALNDGSAVMDSRLAELRTCEADFTQLSSTSASSSFALTQSARTGDSSFLRGRLQSDTDQFYRDLSQSTRVLLYNLDGTPTIRAGADDSAAETVVTLSPDSYSLVTVDRSLSPLQQDTDYTIFDASFDSGISGNAFGLMDNFWYSPAQSGLSLSYLGNGGYNTSNHTNSAARVAANAGRKDMWYNDEAIDAHLEMVAFKSGSALRDNIVIMIEIQNVSSNGEDHDGQMRTDLLNIITRWQDAADRVDAGIKSRITFVVVAMPELANSGANQHDAVAEMMPDIATLGGYSKVEFIDLHNAIKSYEGGIYANPNDYTESGTGTGTASDPQFLWYAGGDAVHPTLVGSQKQMEILWSVITDAAADPSGFSFTVNTPADGTDVDTYAYSLSGSLPTDRLITWFVDDVETAYGDNFLLPAVVGTYVVSAQVDALDGARQTVTASSVTISASNSSPTIGSWVNQTAGTITEGDSVSLLGQVITDPDSDSMTYSVSVAIDGVDVGPATSLSPLSGNVTGGVATASHTTTTAGSYVFTLTVDDGNGGTDSATVSVTVEVAPSETLLGEMTATTIGSNNMNNASFWTVSSGMEAWYDSFHSGNRNINTFMGVNSGITRMFLNAGPTPNPTTAELDALAASLSSGGTQQLRVVMGSVTYAWTGTWSDVNATVNPRIDYPSSGEVLKDGVATTATQFKNDLAASNGESIAVQIWEL